MDMSECHILEFTGCQLSRTITTIYQKWSRRWEIWSSQNNDYILNNTFNLYLQETRRNFASSSHRCSCNVDGTTVHSGLGINSDCNSFTIDKLSKALKDKLRFENSEFYAKIFDEILMVSNLGLLQFHKRLFEILSCFESIPFAEKSNYCGRWSATATYSIFAIQHCFLVTYSNYSTFSKYVSKGTKYYAVYHINNV